MIIGNHKKIWSRAKTIFVAPSLPPPFPPQSSVFQEPERAFIWCFTQRIIKKKREEGGEKGGKKKKKEGKRERGE